MVKLSLEEYRRYAYLNPELVAIVMKEGNSLLLISDMEYGGENEKLRVENMCFELDMTLSFRESIVECRGRYAGGVTFPLENCSTFDEAFGFFLEQSASQNFYLIDDDTWRNIICLDFDEAFVVERK